MKGPRERFLVVLAPERVWSLASTNRWWTTKLLSAQYRALKALPQGGILHIVAGDSYPERRALLPESVGPDCWLTRGTEMHLDGLVVHHCGPNDRWSPFVDYDALPRAKRLDHRAQYATAWMNLLRDEGAVASNTDVFAVRVPGHQDLVREAVLDALRHGGLTKRRALVAPTEGRGSW